MGESTESVGWLPFSFSSLGKCRIDASAESVDSLL